MFDITDDIWSPSALLIRKPLINTIINYLVFAHFGRPGIMCIGTHVSLYSSRLPLGITNTDDCVCTAQLFLYVDREF